MSDDIVEVDGIRYRRHPAAGWHTVDTVGNLLARAPGSLLDEIVRLRAEVALLRELRDQVVEMYGVLTEGSNDD